MQQEHEKSIKAYTVAAINDLSGSSRCSLTVAIPVLYAMGIKCCALPTAILSNHTGYSDYFFDDYTDKMPEFAKKWQGQNLRFNAIYTGFLGSEHQIDIVSDFIENFKDADTKLIIDPVMGDDGKIYTTYNDEMCKQMKRLIKNADLITPNLTEACALCDMPYSGEEPEGDIIEEILHKLYNMGAKNIVVTGIKNRRDNTVSNAVYNGEVIKYFTSSINKLNYTGTGDLFASVVCGKIVKGSNVFDAVSFATDYIYKVGEHSVKMGLDINEGMCFEKFISELADD